MTDFKPGDRVMWYDEEYEVKYGPFSRPHSGPEYLLAVPGMAHHYRAAAEKVTAVPEPDSRRVAGAKALHAFYHVNNNTSPWDELADCVQTTYLEYADAVLAAADAVQATTLVLYRDNDGDTWKENPDGTFSMVACVSGVDTCNYQNVPAEEFHSDFGPTAKL
ncbi:hypothetical protein LHJ74_30825 [Streptomyces sp. N2-109]|uniref:Uncharacterized protein n=1 Tax=Streptomyces gossypii TaxID=2883101 RepID=A0ABT2K2P4_9ACTN|nr:hypothetical protein [Streptomyces gossypii]MCT2594251.1 hypothetical protein [Streptomyces gossypii]